MKGKGVQEEERTAWDQFVVKGVWTMRLCDRRIHIFTKPGLRSFRTSGETSDGWVSGLLTLTCFLKSLSTDTALRSCFPSWVRCLALTWHFSTRNWLWHQDDNLNLYLSPWTIKDGEGLGESLPRNEQCCHLVEDSSSVLWGGHGEQWLTRTWGSKDCRRALKFAYLVTCVVWLSVTFKSGSHFKVSLSH